MSIEQYTEIRHALSLERVSFGSLTVRLFPADELEEAQLGYSVGDAGEDFTGEKPGDWRRSWLVIGYEDLLGEPLFVDLSVPGLPVFTAAHGAGSWNPVVIATSFTGFIEALKEVERVSQDRANPVEVQRNPIPDDERRRVLERIAELNAGASLEFWESWLEL